MSDFRFDPVQHEYWLGDRRLPSVSEIIAPLVDYSMVPEDRLNFARDRGTAVHLACHLDDANDLDESTVDEVNVLPYLNAWRKFKREHSPQFEASEEPMYHSALMYAGTPDRVMRIRRHRYIGDIKTVAKMSPATGVQIGGYELLVLRTGGAIHVRLGIQLRADGTYKIEQYPDETATFLSLLNLHNWRMRHGVKQ